MARLARRVVALHLFAAVVAGAACSAFEDRPSGPTAPADAAAGDGALIPGPADGALPAVPTAPPEPPRWAHAYVVGALPGSGIADLGLDETSDIVIVGGDDLPPGFGCADGNQLQRNGVDAYVAKLRGADGNCIWDRRFGAAETQKMSAVSVALTREIFVAGQHEGAFIPGGKNIFLAGTHSSFALSLAPDGTMKEALGPTTGAGNAMWSAVAIAALLDDGWVWGGAANGNHLLDGVELTPVDDGFINRRGKWLKVLSGEEQQAVLSLAVGGGNAIYAGGSFRGRIQEVDPELASMGDLDAFIVKVKPDGAVEWGRSFGDAVGQAVTSMATDRANMLYATGTTAGTVTLGATTLTPIAGAAVFVTKLTSDGDFQWAKMIATTAALKNPRIAVRGAQVVVAGTLTGGSVDCGGVLLVGQGEDDVFVCQLSTSDGSVIRGRLLGGTGTSTVVGLGILSDGDIAVGGRFTGIMDLGGGMTLESTDGGASLNDFVARLAP